MTAAGEELRAVLRADLEEAVAAITEAESAPAAGLEARKAQAVIARSWLLANRRRHGAYDYCDTTHCQVWKEARPSPAAAATRGVVVTYRGRVFAPAYCGSCGGRTKTAAEVGWSAEPYPYFAVACEVCRREEPGWERRLPELPERERIAVTMRFCDAVPQSYIAARMGVPPAQVEGLLRTALARLRNRT